MTKLLRRYDLSRETAVRMRWQLLVMNSTVSTTPTKMAVECCERVLATRPGLDPKKVFEMIHAIWEAEN